MTPPTSTRRLFLTHMGAAALFQGAAPGRLRATSAPAPHARPQDLGLDPTRLDRAYALVQRMLSPVPNTAPPSWWDGETKPSPPGPSAAWAPSTPRR